MERRYIVFIALSLAIVFGSQLLQATFFPKPPRPEADPAVVEQAEGDVEAAADADAETPPADAVVDAAVALKPPIF